MAEATDIAAYFYTGVLLILGLGMVCMLIRLIIGPSLPDRVVALDLLGNLSAGVICVYAIMTDRPGLIAVAIIIALVLFLGTAAFAQYLQRRTRT